MSPKPISSEQLRALRQPREPESEWHTIPGHESEPAPPGFIRHYGAVLLVGGAAALALCLLGWTSWTRFSEVSRELGRTKLELAAANESLAGMRSSFEQASVIHDLWGLGSQFAAAGAAACSADDDRNKVRTATSQAIEMWSDSHVRAEIDLERAFLPVLRGLRAQQIQVVGASLPAGVLAQYRTFRRDALGPVLMLDPARISDAASREATLAFLRRVGEGQLDPAKTSLLYRLDDYGSISYPIVQGAADATLLRVRLSEQSLAEPLTVGATSFPCS